MEGIELIGTIIAALLTVIVLSYLIGDNALFRVATHMFIGIAAGYAGSMAWHSVLKPTLIDPVLETGLPGILDGSLLSGAQGRLMIGAWILILMMLLKLSPSTSRWGTLPLVIMVGVGAGVIIGGAITGTLIPQSSAAVVSLNPGSFPPPSTGNFLELLERLLVWIEPVVNVLIMLVGTVCTLLYFHFTAKKSPTGVGERPAVIEQAAKVGKVFIAITFGTMYAGALAATLIVLSERMDFLVNLVRDLLSTL
jgi:hypothetical protein